MAKVEEDDDSHNLLVVLFPWELGTPRTFCVHWHIRGSLRHYTNESFWPHLVSEHFVRRRNNDHSPVVPQIRPQTGHVGLTSHLSCWIDRR